MSNASTWANDMRQLSTDTVAVLQRIDKQFNVALRNARRHHELDPAADPDATIKEMMSKWLTDNNATGAFPNPDDEDYWQAILVLNELRGAMTEDGYEVLEWLAI